MSFIKHNGLEILQAPELEQVEHGFFTRKGGVSQGAIAALNCGFGADEPRENVEKNRDLAREAFGAKLDVQTVYQCHSADVLTIDEPISGEPPKCDAIVTKAVGLPIGVLTADCGPILFADEKNKVIGAAHAGWRGAVGGVIENTVAAMERLGATTITAVLGPTISMQNYEVGEEFFEQFCDENPRYSEYFSRGAQIYFNLPRFILDRLRAVSVDAHWCGECTYADPSRYYSFRRATHLGEPDYGRLLSAILLKN